MNTILVHLFILVVWVCLTSAPEDNSYVIIINKQNQQTTMIKNQISDLFLKKTRKWTSRHKVIPVDQTETSPARIKFSKDIHGKTVAAIKSFWQQQIFTGRGVPLEEKTTDMEVLICVKSNTDAISYVSDKTSLKSFPGVKKLKIQG